jgi:hypothetical protein
MILLTLCSLWTRISAHARDTVFTGKTLFASMTGHATWAGLSDFTDISHWSFWAIIARSSRLTILTGRSDSAVVSGWTLGTVATHWNVASAHAFSFHLRCRRRGAIDVIDNLLWGEEGAE